MWGEENNKKKKKSERVKFRLKETACRIKLIYNNFFVCAVNCAAMYFL